MGQDDPQLHERIAALADADLVRMLTRDADDHSVGALLAARAEARRRNIDPEQTADEPRAAPAPEETAASIELTAPLDTRRLTSLWPWVLIVAAGVAIEVWVIVQERQATRNGRMALLAGSLLGFAFYLRAVHRVHRLLKDSTDGRYPISPGKAVGMHLVPVLGFFWPFHWGTQLARFTERNGEGRAFNRYVPGVLFLAAYAGGYLDGVLRLLLLCATVWYVQFRLTRSMQNARLSQVDSGDWSSSVQP